MYQIHLSLDCVILEFCILETAIFAADLNCTSKKKKIITRDLAWNYIRIFQNFSNGPKHISGILCYLFI